MTVNFKAESAYGFTGQYVARITGRDPKFTFKREFVGRKCGKRGDVTSYDTDEPGLYEECSVTKRGKDSTYWLMLPDSRRPSGFMTETIDKADAMRIAKAIAEGIALDQLAHSTGDTIVMGPAPAHVVEPATPESTDDGQTAVYFVDSEFSDLLAALQLAIDMATTRVTALEGTPDVHEWAAARSEHAGYSALRAKLTHYHEKHKRTPGGK